MHTQVVGRENPQFSQHFSHGQPEVATWPSAGSVFDTSPDVQNFGEQPAPKMDESSHIVRTLDTTEGSTHTQKDWQGIIAISKQVQPKWDGEPSSWKSFWKLWEYFWNFRKDTLEGSNPETKKWIFVDCLPKDEADRARHLIIDTGISFEALVNKYHADNNYLVPRFQAESLWRAFVPHDKKWRNVDMWFSKWKRMAAEIPELSELQMIEQFDMVISGIADKVVKEYKKAELLGKTLSLEERWNLVANELSVRQIMSQINNVYQSQQPKRVDTPTVSAVRPANPREQRSRSPREQPPRSHAPKEQLEYPIICFYCRQEGHKQAECPARQGRPPSRGSSRDSDRSNGSRRSQSSRDSGYRQSSGRNWDKSRSDTPPRFSRDGNTPKRDSGDRQRFGDNPNRSFSDRRSRQSSFDRPPQRGVGKSRSDNPDRRTSQNFSRDSSGFNKGHQGGYQSDGRQSPRRYPDKGYQSEKSQSRDSSSSGREMSDYTRGDADRPRRPGIPSRSELLDRQRSNKCLTCGDSGHSTGACPRSHRGRSPTPRTPSRDQRAYRPKVEFQGVSSIHAEPLTSVREGDVSEVDEQIVDAYMAARSIAGYVSSDGE